jgi:hypothetical protein
MRIAAVIFAAVMIALLVAACMPAQIPESIKMFAADLPARADGQYAPLDVSVKKQLVETDALLQCKIDVTGGAAETASAACKCAESAGDWLVDCKSWLGAHLPVPAAKEVQP